MRADPVTNRLTQEHKVWTNIAGSTEEDLHRQVESSVRWGIHGIGPARAVC
jgi:hypothetical protein